MRDEFPYVRTRPLIKVVLKGPQKKIKLIALVDSGADYSVVNWEIGEKLGIEIKKGESNFKGGKRRTRG